MTLQVKAAAFTAALIDLLQAVNGGAAVAPEPEPAAPAAPAGRRGRRAKEPPAVTLEDVRGALIALNEARDKQAVVEVLSRFGVGKIGDLPAEHYAECKAAAEEAAAEEEEPEGEDDPFAE